MSECDKCDSDMCDVCGVAQKAQEDNRSYGSERRREKKEMGPEAAFADAQSRDHTLNTF